MLKLWRPVGPIELKLIQDSGWAKFPPRLPEQPIFYPVCNKAYAEAIAKNWNVKDSGEGYVVEFYIAASYIAAYDRHIVGGKEHEEYWIPAEDLETFNNNIIGKIRLVSSFKETI